MSALTAFIARRINRQSRLMLGRRIAAFAGEVRPGERVLDAGAGKQPFREFFAHAVYETADFHKVEKVYQPSTYVCDLTAIPVPDASFDHVLLTQVLEHVPEPRAVVCELARVLKPGGRILVTAPFSWEEHEKPYDFYRYTQFAYGHLFKAAGLEIVRIDWMTSYLATAARQLGEMGRYLPAHPRQLGGGLKGLASAPAVFLFRGLALAMGLLLASLDAGSPYRERGYPLNYGVLGRKPLSPS